MARRPDALIRAVTLLGALVTAFAVGLVVDRSRPPYDEEALLGLTVAVRLAEHNRDVDAKWARDPTRRCAYQAPGLIARDRLNADPAAQARFLEACTWGLRQYPPWRR